MHFMGSSSTFGESMARHCLHCFLAALGSSAAAKTFSCAMALLISILCIMEFNDPNETLNALGISPY